MIIDRGLDQKGTDANIGTSRVNLTQRYVESVKYNGLGDFTEELREEADYRKRIEKIFSEIHMTGETYADLQPEALMEAYWQGEEMISRYYWAKRRDTDDIIWVRVDVRIVPQLDTGDLFAFYNNWDVTHEKNRDRMMQLIIEFDYDYVEYICLQNGHFEIMAQEKSSMCPSARGTDYDADIRDYLTRVAVTDQLEAHIRAMQTEEIRRNLEAEPLYIQEIDVRESDGSVRRKMIRYTYMDKQMGTVFKSCVDIEDIVTEEKKKQERLERAIEETERANCAKSEFLAHMSHDIRTPMNAIIGMTSVARQECQDDTICGYLDKIKSSSEFLLGLINDMLDISRIESGNLNLKSEQMSRKTFGTAINTTIGPLMEQKNITFQCDLQHMEEMIYTDAVRFKQIFFNLLSNAAKYTPEGGNVWLLTERLRTEGNVEWVRFTVRDSGIGMSEEFVQKLFSPFERERSSTVSRTQGTGLGMAITKNIVDMMGGNIEIQTEQGKGTEFIVRLPLRIQSKHHRVEKIAELEGLKALVIDDDFNTCDSVTKMLAKVGMRSEWTLSGKEAVLRARQSIELGDAFHAYIIDWRLPDMNGIEVTRQIRSLGDDTPIIILTAYDWSDIEVEARAAGVTAFCAKPMFMSDIRDTLMTAIGQKQAEAETAILPTAGSDFRGRYILLVEDNELNSEIAVEILNEYGFLVDTAENGTEAVEKVKKSTPGNYDLVLMDVQMPVMNGYEATKQIRALDNPALAGITILAMTANAFDEDKKKALECGMDGVLSKPIVIEELISILQKNLD